MLYEVEWLDNVVEACRKADARAVIDIGLSPVYVWKIEINS